MLVTGSFPPPPPYITACIRWGLGGGWGDSVRACTPSLVPGTVRNAPLLWERSVLWKWCRGDSDLELERLQCVCCLPLSAVRAPCWGHSCLMEKQQLGRCCFRLLLFKKRASERGESSTEPTSWHWRGRPRSCGCGHPTLCHSVDERFLLLPNHAWNAACHLGYFCYLSLSVPQC